MPITSVHRSHEQSRYAIDYNCYRRQSLAISSSSFNSQPPQPSNGGGSMVKFHAAPMQGYSNKYFRHFLRLLSDKIVLWTEMEKVDDLLCLRSGPFQVRLQCSAADGPTVLQFGGNDHRKLAEVIDRLEQYRCVYDEYNLNCGCPSIETGGSKVFGAYLMKDPELVRCLASKLSTSTPTPVSIKCRIGVRDDMVSDGSSIQDDYGQLVDFVNVTSQGGVRHFIVHARAAVLAGLSPAQNRVIPPLRHDFVHQLAHDFPHLDITLNGGISSMHHLKECLLVISSRPGATIKGIMAGRWLLRRPLDVWFIDQEPSISCAGDELRKLTSHRREATSRTDAVQRYFRYLSHEMQHVDKSPPMEQVMLPIVLVLEQLKDDYDVYAAESTYTARISPFATHVLEIWSIYAALVDGIELLFRSRMDVKHRKIMDCIVEAIDDHRCLHSPALPADASGTAHALVDAPPLGKLLSVASSFMSKKVVNKVLKNRCESGAVVLLPVDSHTSADL